MRPSSALGIVVLFVPAALAAVTGSDVRSPAASSPALATPTPPVSGHPVPARTDPPPRTPTPKPATTPEPKPTSFATAPPRPATTAVPISLGAVPRAGTLELSDGGRSWSYDGATGRIVEIARPTAPAKDGAIPADARAVLPRPGTADVAWIDAARRLFYRHDGAVRPLLTDRRVDGIRWSPDARLLGAQEAAPANGIVPFHPLAPVGLWAVVPETGVAHLVYSAPPIANLRQPPDWYASFRIASWSPDGRYVALWKVGLVSASLDADGRQLAVFDVETGASTDLGWTLLGPWLVWRAPHTLAYISGGNRFTWDHKTLRTWSPERGLRDLTRPDEIALAPVWSADGREILFVRGPSGDYVPLQHFSGTGVGARTLVAIDPATGDRRTLPTAPGRVQEGVLLSRDGSARLEIRRGTVAPTWKPGDPDPAIEIWYVDGAGVAPLVRLTTIGFGYYGAYPALSSFSWSR